MKNGTVNISIEEFDELRQRSEALDKILEEKFVKVLDESKVSIEVIEKGKGAKEIIDKIEDDHKKTLKEKDDQIERLYKTISKYEENKEYKKKFERVCSEKKIIEGEYDALVELYNSDLDQERHWIGRRGTIFTNAKKISDMENHIQKKDYKHKMRNLTDKHKGRRRTSLTDVWGRWDDLEKVEDFSKGSTFLSPSNLDRIGYASTLKT